MSAPSSDVRGQVRPRAMPDRESAGPSAGADSAWVSDQVRLMAQAWADGRPITADEVLRQNPALSVEQSVRLVYEEVCLRREAGQDVSTTEITDRYPQWKAALEVLFECDHLLWPLTRAAVLPEVGEQLGPFRLLAELGRGAAGKTFLAEEPALADRLVVLKVSALDQDEHLSLARLQHTNIIPLYSEHAFADRGLRALCMPYFGGVSLAHVLSGLAEISPDRRRGRHILEILDRAQAELVRRGPSTEGPYRRYLEQASYVQAVCWIVACLSDALHEAHVHNLVHMDVKPSNVLIAGDGLPMLLDFHLARRPLRKGERHVDRLGGTLTWMAPEQQEAMEAVSLGKPAPELVDHRVDLFAVGLLLAEALAGGGARALAAAGKPWRFRNPQVSVGLSDIIQKCLAGNPADRYPDAASVADDLRRHHNDLPLRGAPNRSWAERWRKWRNRQPTALVRWGSMSLAALAVLAALTLALASCRQRVLEMETARSDAERLQGEHRFAEAIQIINRSLESTPTWMPMTREARANLMWQFDQARLGQEAAILHDLAEIVRFRYGLMPAAGEEARELIRTITSVVERCDELLTQTRGTPDSPSGQTIQADLTELAIVRADLTGRLAVGRDAAQGHREALTILDDAARVAGPSAVLDRERRFHAKALGESTTAAERAAPPQSAWEHYSLGRCYLREGAVRQAADAFQQALNLEPQDFWPNFYQGLCAYELGRYEDAIAAFRTCIALAPLTAYSYYNRGRAAEALGRASQASSDYGRALELDPKLAIAALNRGNLSFKAGRFDAAIADFQRAIKGDLDRATAARAHYGLALAYHAQGDFRAARASLDAATRFGYSDRDALRGKLGAGP